MYCHSDLIRSVWRPTRDLCWQVTPPKDEPHVVMTRHAAAVAEDREEEAGHDFAAPLPDLPEAVVPSAEAQRAEQHTSGEQPRNVSAVADDGVLSEHARQGCECHALVVCRA